MRRGTRYGLAAAGAVLLCAAAAIGCARERITVTVDGKGSWTRKTAYIVSDDEAALGGARKAPAVTPEAAVRNSFILPTGAGWTFKSEATKDERRVIATRTQPLDQAITDDIVVKESAKPALPDAGPAPNQGARLVRQGGAGVRPDAPAKALTSNSATVKQLGPGRYLYTETVHWTGEMPQAIGKLNAKEAEVVRAALPAGSADDETVRIVSEAFGREFDLAMIGPPSPMIHRVPMLMSSPETFARLASQRIGASLSVSLKSKLGGKLTDRQRGELVARLIQGMLEQVRADGPGQAGSEPSADNNKNSSGTSIFIIVKLPGRIVSTNGTPDPFTGEVAWSFYPEAAAYGDLTLMALYDS